MATRPRTSRTVAGWMAQALGCPVYEDFEPKFEWQEEPTVNFLSVSLPGFAKKQIKVTYNERPRTVKVHGERPLGPDKFSRFSKKFHVPENCKPGEIRGKFKNGTLVLTLPKKTVTQVPPKEAPPQVRTQKQSLSTEKEPKSPKVGQQSVPPKTTSSDDIGKKKSDDKTVAGAKEAVDQRKHQKDLEDTPPKASSSDPTSQNASRVKPKEAASNTMSDRDAYRVDEGLGIGAKEKGDRPADESQTIEKPKYQQTAHDKGNKTSSQNEGNVQKNGEIEVSRKNNIEARLDDEAQKLGIPKAISGKKVTETEDLVGAVKRAVKGLTRGSNEDRQLIVNMGVAIVVIVALGAYLSYIYGSSTREKN
ncbi:hypothetical protein NL676_037472 [Syzygium grande]|nr:hypothetical protein NL676_037472 [Syzygium grande]